jgi:glyoxylase-like metal-dependent hydrolase (beta-lactamase superfamily II)
MDIKRIRVGRLMTNCYVVSFDGVAFVIDPGADAGKINDYCQNHGLKVEAILLTHGHHDHVGAVAELKALTKAQVYCSPQTDMVANSAYNMAYEMGETPNNFEVDQQVNDGDHITIGDMTVTAITTPGHTSGCTCFVIDGNIFSGDTLFQTSYGRTDLPTGNFATLQKSIQKLFSLDGDYNVHPGHGFSTTLEAERKHNIINFDD